jgi:hypothetical protein
VKGVKVVRQFVLAGVILLLSEYGICCTAVILFQTE